MTNSSPTGTEKPSASSYVVDASALLAAILHEPGGDVVSRAVRDGGFIGSVNLSETVSRLFELAFDESQVTVALQVLDLAVVDLDSDLAWLAARLRASTRSAGLSLGDRACLALAATLNLPALTADRNWANVDVGVEVVLCR